MMAEPRQVPVATSRYIAAVINGVSSAYHPLVWLIGETAEDTSEVIARLASQHKVGTVAVGQHIAEALAPLTRPQRRRKVGALLEDVAKPRPGAPVFLDHIEVLFEPSLSIGVGRQMEALSRLCGTLIVVWPGDMIGNELYYGSPGHPENQTHPVGGCPVVRLDSDLGITSS